MKYVSAIEARHSALKEEKVRCSMDGLKLYLERPHDDTTQSKYFNGCTNDHYITNVFMFNPDRTIPMIYINILECVHDSQVTGWENIHAKLETMFNKYGVHCAVDTGFGKIAKAFMLKSVQDNLSSNKKMRKEARDDVRVKRAATSMCQSTEWGMRGFQASFSRMKDCLDYEDCGERHFVMKMYVLFDLRSWLEEFHQIRNTYMSWLDIEAYKEFTN